MFWKRKKERSFYEKELERLQDELQWHTPDEEEYANILERIERMSKLAEKKPKIDISGDTMAKCITYLIGIGAVIGVELRGGLLRSEATKFIMKP